MPLILNDQFKSVDIPNAIATVGGITLSDSHLSMTFSVNYRAAMADIQNYYNSEFYSCQYDISGDDIVTQAYSYLKTLDKFSSSAEN